MHEAMPPCGLYRTSGAIGAVEGGRLVYFHNHGDPGPGVYLPSHWQSNRAHFSTQGITLPTAEDARLLVPLLPEGFYAVREAFHCCDKQCQRFPERLLVQLGYQASAQALLFVPTLRPDGLHLPARGTAVDEGCLAALEPVVTQTAATRRSSLIPRIPILRFILD